MLGYSTYTRRQIKSRRVIRKLQGYFREPGVEEIEEEGEEEETSEEY